MSLRRSRPLVPCATWIQVARCPTPIFTRSWRRPTKPRTEETASQLGGSWSQTQNSNDSCGEVYRRCAAALHEGDEDSPLTRSPWHLIEHLGVAPALIVACTQRKNRRLASVFPAIQNLLLAARALGLGTTLTTSHFEDEPAVRRILGLPDDVATYCIIPVGYPLGRWGEARRKPVEDVTYRDHWGNPFRIP
jgi:nitroreductase family protein